MEKITFLENGQWVLEKSRDLKTETADEFKNRGGRITRLPEGEADWGQENTEEMKAKKKELAANPRYKEYIKQRKVDGNKYLQSREDIRSEKEHAHWPPIAAHFDRVKKSRQCAAGSCENDATDNSDLGGKGSELNSYCRDCAKKVMPKESTGGRDFTEKEKQKKKQLEKNPAYRAYLGDAS
jgi:hypothetical protein